MKIKIFGKLTDIFKTNEYILNQEIDNVKSLMDYLYANFPELKTSTYLIAINNEFINEDKNLKIKENDEVALLPPYSGG